MHGRHYVTQILTQRAHLAFLEPCNGATDPGGGRTKKSQQRRAQRIVRGDAPAQCRDQSGRAGQRIGAPGDIPAPVSRDRIFQRHYRLIQAEPAQPATVAPLDLRVEFDAAIGETEPAERPLPAALIVPPSGT